MLITLLVVNKHAMTGYIALSIRVLGYENNNNNHNNKWYYDIWYDVVRRREASKRIIHFRVVVKTKNVIQSCILLMI